MIAACVAQPSAPRASGPIARAFDDGSVGLFVGARYTLLSVDEARAFHAQLDEAIVDARRRLELPR